MRADAVVAVLVGLVGQARLGDVDGQAQHARILHAVVQALWRHGENGEKNERWFAGEVDKRCWVGGRWSNCFRPWRP